MNAPYDPYESFALFYDFLIGDRDELPFLCDILSEELPENAEVLELACGTGSLLEGLQKEYSVCGLDRCEEMLAVARQKLPGVPFFHGDMTSFSLDKKFDAILCCFNSINHLLSFRDWKRTFLSVAGHLKPGGVFIFDMNTLHGLSLYPEEAPLVIENENTLGVIRYRKLKTHHISMDVSVFREAQDGSYLRTDSHIHETSFDTNRVKDALSLYFKPVYLIDPERMRPGAHSEIIYFIASLRS